MLSVHLFGKGFRLSKFSVIRHLVGSKDGLLSRAWLRICRLVMSFNISILVFMCSNLHILLCIILIRNIIKALFCPVLSSNLGSPCFPNNKLILEIICRVNIFKICLWEDNLLNLLVSSVWLLSEQL